MPAQDVALTFDTSSFEKGSENARKSMQSIGDSAKNISGGITRGFSAITTKLAGITAGFFALKGAMKSLPEIGKSFSIAGEILSKNLLWPLRQALMPILQSMLDWVRDHRALFVKWGEVLANGFRVAVSLAKSFWDILKSVGSIIMDTFGGFSDFISQDFSRTMGIIQAKLVFAGELIALAFEKAAEAYKGSGLQDFLQTAVQVFSKIAQYARQLGTAFLEGIDFEGIGSALDGVFGALSDIFELLFPKGGDVSWLETVFKGLGEALSALTVGALGIIEATLKGIKITIEWLIEWLPKLAEKWENVFGGAESRTGTVSGGGKSFNQLQNLARESRTEKVDDAIIKPNGQIIKTNPNDTIFASKNGMPSMNASISVNMNGVSITATQGDAQQVGYGIAAGIGDRIRDELLNDQVRQGG